MISNQMDKIQTLQDVFDNLGMMEQMLIRLVEDHYSYSPHCVKMEINNLKKVKDTISGVRKEIKEENEDEEERIRISKWNKKA
ncbi:hypothetical protein ACJMK2_006915 [Sinanodonta woodiana]|uniref:Uncharacterized protein n=1 Tax=Sinanodonta woodiana TaxID=1069815 RepID=A0ABD3VXX1_SINWO